MIWKNCNQNAKQKQLSFEQHREEKENKWTQKWNRRVELAGKGVLTEKGVSKGFLNSDKPSIQF